METNRGGISRLSTYKKAKSSFCIYKEPREVAVLKKEEDTEVKQRKRECEQSNVFVPSLLIKIRRYLTHSITSCSGITTDRIG